MVLLAILASVIWCNFVAADTPREVHDKFGHHSAPRHPGARIADIPFFDEPIPVYGTLTSLFGGAFFLGYAFRHGVLLALAFTFIEIMYMIFAYVVTQASINDRRGGHFGGIADNRWHISEYGVVNWQSILSNRGAIGGEYFALAYLVIVFLAAVAGNLLSNAIPHKMADIRDYFNCFACGACYDAEAANAAKQMQAQMPAVTKSAEGTAAITTSMSCASIFATQPEQIVRGGVLLDMMGFYFAIRLTTGALRDVYRVTNDAWIGFAVLFVVFVYAMVFYEMYAYGDRIDAKDDKGTQGKRYINKLTNVTFIFVPILLFYLLMQSWYSSMAQRGAFARIRFATDSDEAIYYARTNIQWEFITASIGAGVLLLASRLMIIIADKDQTCSIGFGMLAVNKP